MAGAGDIMMNWTFKLVGKLFKFLFKITFGLLFKGIKALIGLASGKNRQKPLTQEPDSEAQAGTVTTDSTVYKV
jgi:hypothetical protein